MNLVRRRLDESKIKEFLSEYAYFPNRILCECGPPVCASRRFVHSV